MTRATASAALRWCACACAAIAIGAACVPATEELNPRGGLLIRTVPSPASRGEPFTTSDGWTLRVEDAALMTLFSAGVGELGSGDLGDWLFRASEPLDVVIRAVQAGPAVAQLRLVRWRVGRPRSSTAVRGEIGEGVRARFDRVGDSEVLGDCGGIPADFRAGPSVYFRLRAERAGQVERLDLAILRARLALTTEIPVVVVPNALTPVDVPLYLERLFAEPNGALTFDAFARADTDGDGVITARELCNAPVVVPAPRDAGPDAPADAPAEADASAADADADADAGPGVDASAADADADAGAGADADAGADASTIPPAVTLVELLRDRTNRIFGQ